MFSKLQFKQRNLFSWHRDSLLQLPSKVLVSILRDWLTIISVCKLDTAVANKVLRDTRWISAITSQEIVFNGLRHVVTGESYVKWLLAKHLKVSQLNTYITSSLLSMTVESDVSECFSQLTFLRINRINNLHITSSILLAAKQLCELHLTNIQHIEGLVFQTVINVNKPTLTEIDLSMDSSCTGKTVSFVTDSHLSLLSHCSNLTSLTLAGQPLITDLGVANISRRCAKVCEVRLSACSSLTSTAVMALAQYCRQLTVLDVSNCQSVTGTALMTLAECCSGLKALYISHCDQVGNDAVHALVTSCKQLTCLHMNASDIPLPVDATAAATSLLPKLCGVTSRTVFAIATHCTGMRDLHMSNLVLVTDSSIQRIAQHGALTSVDLSYCYRLTNLAVQAIAKKCTHLTHLNISYLPQINDACILTVSMHCAELQILNMNGDTHITDFAINYLVHYCVRLRELAICSCSVTDNALSKIGTGFPELRALMVGFDHRELSLRRFKQFGERAMARLREDKPGLLIIDTSPQLLIPAVLPL